MYRIGGIKLNEILKLKAKAQLEIYHKDRYSIYSFVPITPYPEELELNQEYLSFSCDGDLSWVTKGKEYEYLASRPHLHVKQRASCLRWCEHQLHTCRLGVCNGIRGYGSSNHRSLLLRSHRYRDKQ